MTALYPEPTNSINRRRSGPAPKNLVSNIDRRERPRLSLPPPPSEPYIPRRPQSIDIANQRAHSLGNLTGSESPNSLMDAATFAAAQHNGSLQNFNGPEMHLYPQPVYEEKPRNTPTDPHEPQSKSGNVRDHRESNSSAQHYDPAAHRISSNGSNERVFRDQAELTDDTEPFDTEQSLIEKLKSSSITPNSSLPKR